jgi:alpha-1,2-mannosyltransferase
MKARDPLKIVCWCLFALGVIFTLPPTLKAAKGFVPGGNKDYSLWYEIGQTVTDGGAIYTINLQTYEVRYMYPPTLAVFAFAPLSWTGYTGFVLGFGLLNAAAWALSTRLAIRLAAPPGESPTWLTVSAPTLLAGVYVWDMFHLGQVNLLLLALVLLAATALRRGYGTAAGLCLGIAVAAKMFPLTMICYFIARRSWRATASTIATVLALLFLAPAPFRGWERNLADLADWRTLMIGDQSGATMSGRSSIGFSRRNQSIISVAHRLMRPMPAGMHKDGTWFTVNFVDASPGTAQLVGYAGCLLLGGVLLLSTRLRFGESAEAEGLEWGMVFALAVIASPLSWTYFFCWLLPGWAAVVRQLWVRPQFSHLLGAAIAAALLLGAVTEQFDQRPQAFGITCWGAIALFLTLAHMRRSLGNASPRVPLPNAARSRQLLFRTLQTQD